MACEISFCPLWNAFTTPTDEYILRQQRVRILDFDKGELHSAIGELVNEVF